jgi:hypothetical protein
MTMSADGPTGRVVRSGAEEAIELTVVARYAGVKIVHVRRYLEFGLLEPHPAATTDTPRFDPSSAARVARAERLRRDLGLNYAGAVLVCELLDRISELEYRREL